MTDGSIRGNDVTAGGYSDQFKRQIAMSAIEVMADAFDVPVSRMKMTTRQRASVALARQMAMYLTHVIGQLSMRDVAKQFQREPSTVSYACHSIEDKRDSDVFDAQISMLEGLLRERIKSMIAGEITSEIAPIDGVASDDMRFHANALAAPVASVMPIETKSVAAFSAYGARLLNAV